MLKNFDLDQPFYYESEGDYIPESYLYRVNRGGYGRVSEGFKMMRDSSYDYSVFHYVCQGSGLLIVGNKEYKLSKGDLFLLGTREPHIYKSNDMDRLELLWVEFYGSNSSQLVNRILNKVGHVLRGPETELLKKEIIVLLNQLKANHSANRFEQSILLYGLICKTMEVCQKHSQDLVSYPTHIEKSLNYIKERLHTSIRIADLAQHVHCSVSYFTKSFSKAIGVPPTQYIMMLKVEEASRLLTIDSPTCDYLARLLGFYDTTHFIRTYKKYTGQTPKQFKRDALKKKDEV